MVETSDTVVHCGAAVPCVRVLMITYNHVRYVEQAVRSVMMQETTFPFHLVVLDDCSTDGTQDVLHELATLWPGRMRVELGVVNRNDNRSFVREFEQTQARYVAWLDGDDYWTATDKLQRQVEFMEVHPECPLSFHDVLVRHEDGSREPYRMSGSNDVEFTDLESLWLHVPVAACASMLRKGVVTRFPGWFDSVLLADWALYILHAMHGPVGYFPAVMGVYRVHSAGLWTSMPATAQYEVSIDFLRMMKAELDARYAEGINRALAYKYYKLVVLHAQQKQPLKVLLSLFRCVRVDNHGLVISRQILRRALRRVARKLCVSW
jgi:glycosyltransferase involved in cell wall biosynthesis